MWTPPPGDRSPSSKPQSGGSTRTAVRPVRTISRKTHPVANVFKDNSNNLAAVASVLIAKDLKVASTVNRAFSPEFDGKRGKSVNVRIPASLAPNTRALGTLTTFAPSDLVEATQPVALTTDFYSRTIIDDEDLTLSVQDYARDVLLPQTMAIAAGIENAVIAKLQSVAEDATLDTANDPSDKLKVLDFLVDVRAKLRGLGAPESGLVVALSVEAYAAMLKALGSASFDQGVASMGSGNIVRYAGLSIVESNRLATAEAIAYHKDAITLALKAPAAAESGTSANAMAEQGVPLRVVQAFDHTNGQHISLLNVYGGTALMNANVEGTLRNFVIRVVA